LNQIDFQATKNNYAAAIPEGLAEEVEAYVNSKFILDRIRFTESHPLLPPAPEEGVAVTDSQKTHLTYCTISL
jgi:hypothetical protein